MKKITQKSTIMKTTTTNISLLLLTLILAFGMIITACEGPTGEQGPQGPEGPQGEQGPQGDEGTADVIYSEWISIDWNTADNADFKRMDIIEERINNDFVNSGTLLVYMRHPTSNTARTLPRIFGTDDYVYFSFSTAGEPTIAIIVRSLDGSSVDSYVNSPIRYVMIPGGVPAKISPDFWDDYEAVADYYRIPD